MRKSEGRTIGLFFKVSPEEMELIEKKMAQAGTQNKRAYLRKMAVDGYIVHLDMESVKNCVSSCAPYPQTQTRSPAAATKHGTSMQRMWRI